MRIKEGKFCKRIRQDLWGKIAQKGKFNKLFYYFYLLRLEYKKRRHVGLQFNEKKVIGRKRRLSKHGKLLLSRKKICNFYGSLRLKDYKKFCILAKKMKLNTFSNNLVNILESRLSTLVYRMHFVSSIFEGISKVKSGFFLVNNKLILDPNYLVKVGDIIEVVDIYKELIYYYMLEKTYYTWFITSIPSYLFVNYSLLMGCILKEPVLNMVFYPFVKIKRKSIKRLRDRSLNNERGFFIDDFISRKF